MAASTGQLAKRAFVAVLLSLANQYGLTVKINRDSPDAPLEAAFRKIVKQAHPDKGGSTDDAQKLQAAREHWTKTAHTRPIAGARSARPTAPSLRAATPTGSKRRLLVRYHCGGVSQQVALPQ